MDNFSLDSQQMVPNYFLYPCKCPDRQSQRDFGPIFEQINIPLRKAAISALANLTKTLLRGAYDKKS